MKSILKSVIVTTGIGTAIFLTSCGSEATTGHDEHAEHKHNHADSTHTHQFMCPMNCENGKTYDKAGKCPICGMDLEHKDETTTESNTYFMEYSSSPALEAGKEAVLSFIPKIKGKENEAVPLDIVHEKKLHLIIASNDLAYFEHVHPEYQHDGSYQIKVLPKGKGYSNGSGLTETIFNNGGDYIMFADYAPTGGQHQMDKISLSVNGIPYKKATYNKEKLSVTVDGYTVTLESNGGKWQTNRQMHLKAIVKKGNQVLDANTFENYLGAKSHMVVLKTETFDYLHVHPEVENGNLDLHTTFETPGIYRGWLQFQTEGKVHTADFVIKVEQGNPGENNEAHNGHTH